MNATKSIVLFDGICNLCNYWVDFIIKRDKAHHFLLVPLQSEKAKVLMEKYGIPEESDSVILISGNRIYVESEAIIKISNYLSFPWNGLRVFQNVPLKTRNSWYKWIAQNRYKWFGKRDSCRYL